MNHNNVPAAMSTAFILFRADVPLIAHTDLAASDCTTRQSVESVFREAAQTVADVTNAKQRHSTHVVVVDQKTHLARLTLCYCSCDSSGHESDYSGCLHCTQNTQQKGQHIRSCRIGVHELLHDMQKKEKIETMYHEILRFFLT